MQADPGELRSAVMARMMVDGMESALRHRAMKSPARCGAFL